VHESAADRKCQGRGNPNESHPTERRKREPGSLLRLLACGNCQDAVPQLRRSDRPGRT